MRSIVLLIILFAASSTLSFAQKECASSAYFQQEVARNPAMTTRMHELDAFVRNRLYHSEPIMSPAGVAGNSVPVYKIPVIVHVLYNTPEQNISEEQVRSQIEVLNQDFRKRNSMANIPGYFKVLSTDCFIEFALATMDPQGNPTRGIIRKKTNTSYFGSDDRIKFSRSGGDDAWNSDHYLNIWVAKLSPGMAGYASSPGGPKEKDGIVLRYTAFGTSGTAAAPYHLGRTAVHEAGHWLGLKHIWGNHYCGDDDVADTPPQKGPTKGCPLSVVASCDNAATGSMYMNYMDLTHDACTGMFTVGQRDRMRALFTSGGPRHALLSSQGSTGSLLPAPVELPMESIASDVISIYPNPATISVTVRLADTWALAADDIAIHNHLGQLVMQKKITSKTMQLSITGLPNGLYFIRIGSKQKGNKLIKHGP